MGALEASVPQHHPRARTSIAWISRADEVALHETPVEQLGLLALLTTMCTYPLGARLVERTSRAIIVPLIRTSKARKGYAVVLARRGDEIGI